jgi:surface polysaccharide O-acyltransferase-like enzyme
MRLKRIDVFRLLAIYMVIWAHTQFFDGIKAESLLMKGIEIGVTLLARWSMQFFFIVSGYFVGGKLIESPGQTFFIAWKYTKKLFIVFLFWCVVYAIENPEYVAKLASKEPLTLILEGTRLHLWFLMSMALTIWLFAVWPFDKKGNSLLIFGVIAYIIGLWGGSYQITPIGLNLDFNTRNGIFFSTIFFAIGVLIYLKKPQVSPALAWGLCLAGLALFALETYILWANWTLLPIRNDYLLGSVLYGIGAFFVAFTAQRETKLDWLLAPYAQYVLGVYVAHLLVLDALKPLGAWFDPILWAFIYPMLVFGLTLLGVILLSKTPLRSVVM